MTTMMALRAHVRGGPDVLVNERVEVPRIGPGEVLVDVHAAAITFAELTWEETWVSRDGRDRTPIIPSHEVSGVVSSVADDDSRFRPGDEVFGLIDFDRDGAACEYAAVPELGLALRPRNTTHVQSAALPLAALTAWQALVDRAHVTAGERVLVLGGAGGVGNYVVQLAVSLGCTVIATARAGDLAFVEGLGAHQVLDPSGDGAFGMDQVTAVDVLIDTVSGAALRDAAPLLADGGRLVTLSAPPAPELTRDGRVEATFFVVQPDAGELTHLADLVDRAQVKPVVSQVFSLADGRAAYLEGPRLHRPGKTVISVRD